jgi:hypothetical protein
MQDEYFGDYHYEDEFVMLDQKGSIYEEDLPDSSMDKMERKLYKAEIMGDE